MIINLPTTADPEVLRRAADHLGIVLQPHDLPRYVNTRQHGKVLKVEGVTLRPVTSSGDGKYRAYADDCGQPGRRKHAVCWHAHRDWMRQILAEYPDTVIEGGQNPETRKPWVWQGREHFEQAHHASSPASTERSNQRFERCACNEN